MQQGSRRFFAPRKINEVVFEPGCVSLSYFRQQLYSTTASGRDDESVVGPTLQAENLKFHFLPIIIDSEHAARALPLLKAELVRIDCLHPGKYETSIHENQAPVRVPSDLRIKLYSQPDLLPEFNHEIGLRVIAAIMNANIVKICKEAAQGPFTTDIIVGKYLLVEIWNILVTCTLFRLFASLSHVALLG